MSAQVRIPNTSSAAPAHIEGPLLKGLPHTAGFSDAIGDRQLVFDPAAGISLEVLRFKAEFSQSPEFEAALMSRAEAVANLQHPSIASIHTVGRHESAGLVLISKHTAGRRVSELLPKAQGPAFALELIRLVTPALAALQRLGDGVAHGALSADRIVVTRDGRLVVVEHVLGSAIESLKLSRSRLIELGLAVPAGSDPVKLDARTDMAQLGFIALSLLLGRPLKASDYPDQVPALLDEIGKAAGSPAVAAKLRSWLERALQLSPKSFANARDAQAAFHDLPDDADVMAKATTTVPPSPSASSASSAVVQFPSESTFGSRSVPKPQPVAEEPAAGRSRVAIWAGAGVGLAAIAAGVYFFVLPSFRGSAAPPPAPAPQIETASATIPATTPVLTPSPTPAIPATNPPALPTPSPSPLAAQPSPTATPVATASLAQSAAAPAPVPAGPRFGGMTVKSAIDLQIYENGTLLGTSAAPIAVNEGSHSIEVVNEATGFRLRQTVTVRPGQMSTLNISLPNGRVSVNAVPWAEVEIDGKAAGETPLANLALPIGPHEFTFRHPDLGIRKQTIVVKVEGQTRVTQLFDK